MYPTSPPVKGGNPGITGDFKWDALIRSASNGSIPCGAPAGYVPIQTAAPSFSLSVDSVRTPINEYLDHAPPCSADSSRKVLGALFASFL